MNNRVVEMRENGVCRRHVGKDYKLSVNSNMFDSSRPLFHVAGRWLVNGRRLESAREAGLMLHLSLIAEAVQG